LRGLSLLALIWFKLTILMGAGDDKFVGGFHVDLVFNESGADNYMLGNGEDNFFALARVLMMHDTIDGRAGSDTYDASFDTSSILVNLDTIEHN
jgi:hypothetical protein